MFLYKVVTFTNWIKMAILFWIRLDQICPKWIKLNQIGLIWIKLDQIGSKKTKLKQTKLIASNQITDEIGSNRIKSDQILKKPFL